ncbi:hypothetical protein BV25DRAFT_1843004 [Artomyces pyxidatus]|uniref:Uncharacterized protein n=1 Tax=Artomyces pyxidatus TaxID=48021 RepID=A0ACB8SG98_9AGAM|nr:hypothetical protein BV25DRAFT_1843004 [Artomyces pyxidatus]
MSLSFLNEIRQDLVTIRRGEAVRLYEYVAGSLGLIPWKWPIDAQGMRISPADVIGHRESHNMRWPCCFCRLHRGWVECAVYRATSGPFRGHYIASCAEGRCEYAVNLDRVYRQEELLTKTYPVRGGGRSPDAQAGDSAPPVIPITNRTHLSQESIRRLRIRSIALYHPPASVAPTPFDLLLRLDSHSQPGITVEQFLGLFVQCAACRLVMTMGATNVHHCALLEGNQDAGGHGVIDLTEEDSE